MVAEVPQLIDRDGAIVTVGDLAHPAPIVSGDAAAIDVDALFAQNRALRAVIVDRDGTLSVLTRDHLQAELTGRLGYGRALHSRAFAADLAPDEVFALPADMSPADAARQLLNREESRRYDDVLVIGFNDRPRLVSVSKVFEQVADEFRFVALHDPLTSLPNRRFLEDHARRLSGTSTQVGPIAILYIDLDGFKLVNDTYGHSAGDRVLSEFATRLRGCLRPHDIAVRLGGDEFVAVITDVTEEQANIVAERMVVAASAPFLCELELIYLSASVGVFAADGSDDAHSLEVLLRNADAAMLSAKKAGRARIGHLDSTSGSDGIARQAMITRGLQTALSTNALHLVYQPQLDLATGDCTVVEALARWTHEELGPISPVEFIAIAERSDQINRLGLWVIDAAAAQVRTWLDAGQPRTVSINVSPSQLRDGTLLDSLLSALARHGIPASLLRVEITEGMALDDTDDAARQLQLIRDAGFHVELDDFGTGFSSLARLRRLPLTTIKIDKSLIDSIDTDAGDQHLISGLIRAAHHYGLRVTAEGVERERQLTTLRELGCDSVQGYYISKPVHPHELDRLADQAPA